MRYKVSNGPQENDHKFEASDQAGMERIIRNHFLGKHWEFIRKILEPIANPWAVDFENTSFHFKRNDLQNGCFQLHAEFQVGLHSGSIANGGCEFIVKLCYHAIPQNEEVAAQVAR